MNIELSKIGATPEGQLLLSILIQAERDYANGQRLDVEEFLKIKWFGLICDYLNLSLEETREAIINGEGLQFAIALW